MEGDFRGEIGVFLAKDLLVLCFQQRLWLLFDTMQ
jgi:hypothetical protein